MVRLKQDQLLQGKPSSSVIINPPMAVDTPKRAELRAQPPPSSSNPRHSRWQNSPSSSSSKPSPTTKQHSPLNPNPNPNPYFPIQPPPLFPIYGFHMLERRNISLADGSSRSYFALPPNYRDLFPEPGLHQLGPMKRKYGPRPREEEEEEEEVFRGSKPRREEVKVDSGVIKAFLHFVKVINENADTKIKLLEDGKRGPLRCFACDGSSKDFLDVHSLIMHAYYSDNADSRGEHLGLHRALCALMGWNCMRAPDNSRVYQSLPADEAAAFRDDLIMWPPTFIIHNTNTSKGKVGRMEGLGNKAMDSKLRDLGFFGGKSKSLYSRDGHLGTTIIKFAADQLGLKEAMRLSDHFQEDRRGRREWAHIQSVGAGLNDENSPDLVEVDERTGEKTRILYGYLLTAFDMEKVDYHTRKKAVVESKLEKLCL